MRAVLDLIAPSVCASCGVTADGELCVVCAASVAVCSPPWCDRCGHPGSAERCPCRSVDGFDRARSLVAFSEPARSLVLAAKRRGDSRTIAAIGGLMVSLAEASFETTAIDAVTFVPGGKRSVDKGFDHAARLATTVARGLGLPVARLVRRAVDGPRQADVAYADRWSNVACRFTASGSPPHVLLVDDVFTTGATAAACGRALRSSGARSVDVLTFARTIRRAPRR